MSIIVVSDTHLGYNLSNNHVFEDFLDKIQKQQVTDLVLLGDFVDMWRRDVSGIFLEHVGIINRILELKKNKTRIHCIAGNHDYHLLHLMNNELGEAYPLKFCENLELSEGGTTYRFMHGHEFDLMQNEVLIELLCYTMSDDLGYDRSEFWNGLTSITADVKLLENFFTIHKHDEKSSILKKLGSLGKLVTANIENMMVDPSKRNWQVDEVEKYALGKRNEEFPNTTLVFGHTHIPFFDPVNKIINSGSWVTNEKNIPFNTFIEIRENKIQLNRIISTTDHKIESIEDITKSCTRTAGDA